MGFLPIFLYLAGFILLFMLVVTNSFKSKKAQYTQALEELHEHLSAFDPDGAHPADLEGEFSLRDLEKRYSSLRSTISGDQLSVLEESVKPMLGKAKLRLHWYNRLVQKKPYSFVAGIMGYSAIRPSI